MPFIRVENNPLYFRLRRSVRAKRLHMTCRHGEFEIVAPPTVHNSQIVAFVSLHRRWMLKQSVRKKNVQGVEPLLFAWPTEFLAQETLPFRAGRIILHIKYGQKNKVYLLNNTLTVHIAWQKIACEDLSKMIKKQVKEWYQQQAAQIIQSSIALFCPRLDRWPQGFVIKQQKTRWGSCGISQKININWLLLLAPIGVLEYVVAHELCHLWYRNHGKRFWAKVAMCCEHYQECDRWLNKHGYCLQAMRS